MKNSKDLAFEKTIPFVYKKDRIVTLGGTVSQMNLPRQDDAKDVDGPGAADVINKFQSSKPMLSSN